MIVAESFTPFFGVVEDVNDDKENGRVRVRVYGYNTQNKGVLPTDSLRWFSTVVPNTGSLNGVGTSPTGYKKGSFVFGFYIDDIRNQGIVIGSINGLVKDNNDVSKLARGKDSDHIKNLKSSIVKGVKSASGGTWDEPETKYAAKYPNNFVHVTSSGHVLEIDDTEGAERVKIYHKSGSLFEMHPDGTIVVRRDKEYDIVTTDRKILTGTHDEHVKNDKLVDVGGNNTEKTGKDKYEEVEGKTLRKSKGMQQYQAPNIELGEPGSLEPVVLGDKLSSWINGELIPWLNSHNHTSASPGSPTSPPIKPFQAGTAKGGGAVYSKKNKSQ